MKKKSAWILIFLIIAFVMVLVIVIKLQQPKNIIVFISDGCGFNHIAAASIYEYGEKDKQAYHRFPVRYAMSTYSLNNPEYNPEKAWQDFGYVLNKPTDSAASGTALATGFKTLNGKLGVDSANTRLKNAVEHFESMGKSTGVITSVTFAHATPAAFVAHNRSRHNYRDIAGEMILESSVDVIMGCGHPYFDKMGKAAQDTDFTMVGGVGLWNNLLNGTAGNDADGDSLPDYWKLIDERSDFQSMMTGKTPDRVIGVPKVHGTLQEERAGNPEAAAFIEPFNENVPTLKEMTLAAINILDENKNGFFLMVEGGAIDWASHGNRSGRMIEEEIAFNNAVDAAIYWVNRYSSWDETTIIITGDHETGYLTGPGSGDTSHYQTTSDLWLPIAENGKNNMPGMEWHTDHHTNSLIPFFAKGFCAKKFDKYAINNDPVRGLYIDNSDVGKVLLSIKD
jgi:alkaline phosphatase